MIVLSLPSEVEKTLRASRPSLMAALTSSMVFWSIFPVALWTLSRIWPSLSRLLATTSRMSLMAAVAASTPVSALVSSGSRRAEAFSTFAAVASIFVLQSLSFCLSCASSACASPRAASTLGPPFSTSFATRSMAVCIDASDARSWAACSLPKPAWARKPGGATWPTTTSSSSMAALEPACGVAAASPRC